MARLFSFQNGNFTAANGWKLIDGTSFLNSVAANANVTNAFAATASFTPGAITVEGVGIYISNTILNPTGTFEVQLWNATGGVQVALVTINCTDLVQLSSQYAYFKFSTPQTLLAATNYQIRLRSSVTAQVACFSASGTNWSRFLVTSTTATAAASNEEFFVMGDHTGAGAFNLRTMTMDINSTNNHQYLIIGNHGVVNWLTSSNTELRLNTEYIAATTVSCFLNGNSIMNMGTSSNRIASGVTATLYLVPSAAANRVISALASAQFNAYGQPKKRITTLAATITAGATSLTTNDATTGWAIGDQIVIAANRRLTTQTELRTITSVGTNSASWTGGLTNARDGAVMTGAASEFTPGHVAAHIGNLTSNVKIRGVSAALPTRILIQQNVQLNWDNVEFFFHGASANGSIQDASTGSKIDITNSTFYGGTATNTSVISYTPTAYKSGSNKLTVSNSVFYDFQVNGINVTSPTFWTGAVTESIIIEDSFFVQQILTSGSGVTCVVNPITLRRNAFSDCRTSSIWVINLTTTHNVLISNSFEVRDNIVYASVNGITTNPRNNKDTGNFWGGNVVFRCTNIGMFIYGSYNSVINGDRSFGNAITNIGIGSPSVAENIGVDFIDCVLSGETSYASQNGVSLADSANIIGASYIEGSFINCSIGVASGASASHTIADINFRTSDVSVVQSNKLSLDDCTLGSTVKVLNPTRMTRGSYIKFRNFNATNNDHRTQYKTGIIQTDTSITRSSPRSARMTPSSSTLPTDFCSKKYALKAGQSAIVGAYIRKSVIGDGAAYNGTLPQIILKANYSLGIMNDSVIGTATVASSGSWELVTGSIPAVSIDGVVEICIRANGTTGWVNVEDFR